MPLSNIDTSKNITGFDHQNTGASKCDPDVIMIIFLGILSVLTVGLFTIFVIFRYELKYIYRQNFIKTGSYSIPKSSSVKQLPQKKNVKFEIIKIANIVYLEYTIYIDEKVIFSSLLKIAMNDHLALEFLRYIEAEKIIRFSLDYNPKDLISNHLFYNYCEYDDFIKMKNKIKFYFNIDSISKRKIPTLK